MNRSIPDSKLTDFQKMHWRNFMWHALLCIYGAEFLIVAMAAYGFRWESGLLSNVVSTMSSRFSFISSHQQVSPFPEIASLYWSIALGLFPVKCLVLVFASWAPWLVGKERRVEIKEESRGTFLGQMEVIARLVLPGAEASAIKRWLMAFCWAGVFVAFGMVGYLELNVDDLLMSRPTSWPHARGMVVEYLFNSSPLLMAVAGSVLTLFEAACLVLATAAFTAQFNVPGRKEHGR